jgi:hypothetical protein
VQGGAEHGFILVKPMAEGFIEHNKTLGRFQFSIFLLIGTQCSSQAKKNAHRR